MSSTGPLQAAQSSIDSFPAWARLNDVEFTNTLLQDIEGKGFGLVAEKDEKTDETTSSAPTLIKIPHDLVLSAETVEGYAKVDQNFRQLLDHAGHEVIHKLCLPLPDRQGTNPCSLQDKTFYFIF